MVFGLRSHSILDEVMHHEFVPQNFGGMTPLLIVVLIISL
jgi:hypothetical protein